MPWPIMWRGKHTGFKLPRRKCTGNMDTNYKNKRLCITKTVKGLSVGCLGHKTKDSTSILDLAPFPVSHVGLF